MRNMLKTIKDKLEHGQSLVLVTVTASSGATPRGAGARMLIGKEGRICGTIGGGAVEYRSEQIAAKVLEERTSFGHDFTLTKDDVQNLGMICGGACNVYFHYLPAEDIHTVMLCEEAEVQFQKGSDLWLLTEIGDGGRMGLYSQDLGLWGISASEELKLSRHPERIGSIFAEQINTSGRVYVFGGGHVAQELVPVLARRFSGRGYQDRSLVRLARLRSRAGRFFPCWMVLNNMEHLTKRFESMLDAAMRQDAPPAAFRAELAVPYENLLVYFLFRYALKAVNDRQLLPRVAACVFHLLCLRELLDDAGSKTALCAAASLYSKEVEHSEENQQLLLKLFRRKTLTWQYLMSVLDA